MLWTFHTKRALNADPAVVRLRVDRMHINPFHTTFAVTEFNSLS